MARGLAKSLRLRVCFAGSGRVSANLEAQNLLIFENQFQHMDTFHIWRVINNN